MRRIARIHVWHRLYLRTADFTLAACLGTGSQAPR